MEYPLGQRLRELPGPLLLTGHTGFKGTWMTFLLEHLNVPVIGYSLPAEKNSLYDRAERTGAIPEVFADIRNYEALEKFIDSNRPSTIIHMAAQPLVLKSYESPRETFDVNVMGTVNILDIAFKKDFVKAIIVVTTDKVYRNDNSGQAFVESDPLEGKDPYSASKVGTESVVAAWQQITKVSGGPSVVSVRAGNVVGGGDFAENRIIPDLIRGVMTGSPVELRNPGSTRPWEHVIEPLIGYIRILEYAMWETGVSCINFGPDDRNLSVEGVVEIFQKSFPEKLSILLIQNDSQAESKFLGLNPQFAREILSWETTISQEDAVRMTANWWSKFLEGDTSVIDLCKQDIEFFIRLHSSKNVN